MALELLAVLERRIWCWHCAPTSEIRARYDHRYRCARCAEDGEDLEETDRYTASHVEWALRSYLTWQESDAHPPERADIDFALEWVRETQRITPLERETIIVRLVEGSAGKPIARQFQVGESAVSMAIKSATRKIAVWLNSPNKIRLR